LNEYRSEASESVRPQPPITLITTSAWNLASCFVKSKIPLGQPDSPRTIPNIERLHVEHRPVGDQASLRYIELRDGGTKALLEFASLSKGIRSGDQEPFTDGLTAASHNASDAPMAISLDEFRKSAEFTPGSVCTCHGSGRHGTPRPRSAWAETARSACEPPAKSFPPIEQGAH